MPWDVEIHHLDVGTTGDSTLIVARFRSDVGATATHTRTVLIDGGKATSGAIIEAYLQGIGIEHIDVLCVTHYDTDHYMGVADLLERGGPLWTNTILFDPGWPPDSQVNKEFKRYDAAVEASTCRSVTEHTNSWHLGHFATGDLFRPVHPIPAVCEHMFPPDLADEDVTWHPPYWLIGRDVLWGTPEWVPDAVEEGQPQTDHLALGPDRAPVLTDSAPGDAPDPPRLRCVAANMYIARDNSAGGPPVEFVPPRNMTMIESYSNEVRYMDDLGQITAGLKNQKSLGFILEFNNFRYYVAGDLEENQEDGWVYPAYAGADPEHAFGGLRHYLNRDGALAGRIQAIKASHHGAATATSRLFADAVQAHAAFISVSNNNQYMHPKPRTINVLGGHDEIPINSRWRMGYREGVDEASPGKARGEREYVAPSHPPPAARAPRAHYLTGFQWPGSTPPTGKGGRWAVVAGNGADQPGHVLLHVSEEESKRSPEGMKYWVVRAAVHAMAELSGADDPQELAIAVADAAVRYGAGAAAAVAAGGTLDQWRAGHTVAAHLSDVARLDESEAPDGLVTSALAASGGGIDLDAAIAAVRTELTALPARYPGSNTPFWEPGWAAGIEAALPVVIGCAVTAQPPERFEEILLHAGLSEERLLAAMWVGSDGLLTLPDAEANRRWAAVGAAAALGAANAGASTAVATVTGAAIRSQCAELVFGGTARVVALAALTAGLAEPAAALAGMAADLADLPEAGYQAAALSITAALDQVGQGQAAAPVIDRIRALADDALLGSRFRVECYRLPDVELDEVGRSFWMQEHRTEELRDLMDAEMGDAGTSVLQQTFRDFEPQRRELHPHFC